ncbi:MULTISPECIES: trypsin-like peptidase domain-containing protein [Bacteria]|uniref:trypsin-like peptidase domain-containing protein n=1 Tax=Bacteria TaxID=2 RepID=UPI003F37183F
MENLKNIVGEINETGSCFLVNENYILTARHCVEKNEIGEELEINFKFLKIQTKAILIEKLDRPLDLAILKLKVPLKLGVNYLLCDDIVFRGDTFSTFGYPEEAGDIGKVIVGKINDQELKLDSCSRPEDEIDLKLYSDDVNRLFRGYISGLSGSPVIVNNQIIGIVKVYLGDGLGVQQIKNFTKVLIKYGIEIEHKSLFRSWLLNKASENIEMNMRSKKYLRDVHIEINEIKDQIRYFSDPILFFKQLLEKIENLDFSFINSRLEKLNLPIIKLDDFCDLKNTVSLDNIFEYSNLVYKKIVETLEYSEMFKKKEEIIEKYKNMNIENYKSLKYRLFGRALISSYKLREILNLLKILRCRNFFILDTAGKGKTTLLCDFVDRTMIRKNQASIFLSAYKILDGNILNTLKNEFLEPFNINFDEFFRRLDLIGKKEKRNVLFIIDGLNENNKIREFSINLEVFIGVMKKYKNIKILITCRKEYFEERFEELLKFKNDENTYYLNSVFLLNDFELRKKGLKKYFEYFNICVDINRIGSEVEEKLLESPLLLRFFCEAYRGKTYVSLDSLYKYDLFQNYTKEKIKNIDQEDAKKLIQIFDEIIKYMLDNNSYVQIPMEIINEKNLLKKIVHEDVIFKEDLVSYSMRMGEVKNEVISFTFDEYRDFMLATYLIENYSTIQILKKMEEIKEFSIREGVGRYIYHYAKKTNHEILYALEEEEWAKEAFIDYIFFLSDVDVTTEDLKLLEQVFNFKGEYAREIFSNCLKRYSEDYINLNIYTAFSFVKRMESEEYKKAFNESLGLDRYSYYYYKEHKEHLEETIEKIMNNKNWKVDMKLHFLIMLYSINRRNSLSSKIILNIKKLTENIDCNIKEIFIEVLKDCKNIILIEGINAIKREFEKKRINMLNLDEIEIIIIGEDNDIYIG